MKQLLRVLYSALAAFTLLLAGSGLNVRAVVVGASQFYTPIEIDFGPVGVGVSAPQMVVTITNSGSLPLTNWAGGAVPAPFNGAQDCNVPGGLLPGNSCHFYYTFSPSAPGLYSTTSNFSTNAGPFSVKLQGTGLYSVFEPVALH